MADDINPHLVEAELIVREVSREQLPSAQSQHDWRMVEMSLLLAQTHALIAIGNRLDYMCGEIERSRS